MTNDENIVLWVEDWPLKAFFLNRYFEDALAQSQEEKMEIIWGLTQKMLLAQEALNRKFQWDENIIKKNTQVLLKEDEVKEGLKNNLISKEDVFLFLKIEELASLLTQQLYLELQDFYTKNPQKIYELYEQNKPTIKNAHKISQITFSSSVKVTSKLYSKSEILDLKGEILHLGCFSTEEILKHFASNEYEIAGKPVGTLIYASSSKKGEVYFWIEDILPEVIKDFSEVKEDFENFVLSYLAEESLSDLCNQLLDSYQIQYNEAFFENFIQE